MQNSVVENLAAGFNSMQWPLASHMQQLQPLSSFDSYMLAQLTHMTAMLQDYATNSLSILYSSKVFGSYTMGMGWCRAAWRGTADARERGTE
jgi:hypothetical protein